MMHLSFTISNVCNFLCVCPQSSNKLFVPFAVGHVPVWLVVGRLRAVFVPFGRERFSFERLSSVFLFLLRMNC